MTLVQSRQEMRQGVARVLPEITSLVSFPVRLPKDGRLGRDTLGSEGAALPDEAEDTAAAAAAQRMTSFKSRRMEHSILRLHRPTDAEVQHQAFR